MMMSVDGYNPLIVIDYNCGEILSYEEVVKIAPQKNRPRPVVLVGNNKPYTYSQNFQDELLYIPKKHEASPPVLWSIFYLD